MANIKKVKVIYTLTLWIPEKESEQEEGADLVPPPRVFHQLPETSRAAKRALQKQTIRVHTEKWLTAKEGSLKSRALGIPQSVLAFLLLQVLSFPGYMLFSALSVSRQPKIAGLTYKVN